MKTITLLFANQSQSLDITATDIRLPFRSLKARGVDRHGDLRVAMAHQRLGHSVGHMDLLLLLLLLKLVLLLLLLVVLDVLVLLLLLLVLL